MSEITLHSKNRIRSSNPEGLRPSTYLSVTEEVLHNTDFYEWMGKKQFCYFQTAEGPSGSATITHRGASSRTTPPGSAAVTHRGASSRTTPPGSATVTHRGASFRTTPPGSATVTHRGASSRTTPLDQLL